MSKIGCKIKLEQSTDEVPDDWKRYRVSIKIGDTSIFNPIVSADGPDMAIKSALVAVITQYIPMIESIDFREKIEIINCTEHNLKGVMEWTDGSLSCIIFDEPQIEGPEIIHEKI